MIFICVHACVDCVSLTAFVDVRQIECRRLCMTCARVCLQIKRSSSPHAEIFRFQTPPASPPVTGSIQSPETPADIVPQCTAGEREQELDMDILREMVIMCGISEVSETDVREVALAVKEDMAFMPRDDGTPGKQTREKLISDSHAKAAEDGKAVRRPKIFDMYGLSEHGPEAELLPAVYARSLFPHLSGACLSLHDQQIISCTILLRH